MSHDSIRARLNLHAVLPNLEDVVRDDPEMPLAQRHMLLNDLTLHDENFFPAVSQTPEGQVYLMAGAIPAVVRVDGLGSLRRIAPIPLEVTAKDLKLAKEFTLKKEAARQAAAGNGVMNVALDRPSPVLDGKLEDWSLAAWVPIDRRGVAAYFDSNS